ncbi:MAG: (Fe-S)-binding protein, partial [Desulfobacterales bacterium]|nr:(Fe-S)-binding protein [Desulfobacterales bacterium]
GLPRECDTIFFPGCTLPGTRPQRVLQLYERLKEQIPNLGIVLDCCAKPSHDLGRQEYFEAMFQEMRSYLLEHGIQTVLTACPNCHKIFKNYGNPLRVKTVYEVLAENGRPNIQNKTAVVTMHDPCAVRFEYSVHRAVRNLLAGEGLEIEEMPHRQENTLCCGEGGAVSALSPDLARSWAEKRKEEADGKSVITYCAGCANYLGRITPAYHLLDLIFEPRPPWPGKPGSHGLLSPTGTGFG